MWTKHLKPGERQRPVPGWAGYYVTDLGRVFCYKRAGWYPDVKLEREPTEKHPTETWTAHRGHLSTFKVVLSDTRRKTGPKKGTFTVASLVTLAFIGPKPAGKEVCHWDDDYRNNRLSNLRYGTPKDNSDDAIRNGRIGRGEAHSQALLTNAQALEIRESKLTVNTLAAKYNVHREVIVLIKRGQTWAHVGGILCYVRERRARVSTTIVRAIRASEEGASALARKYNISQAAASRIKLGETYKRIK